MFFTAPESDCYITILIIFLPLLTSSVPYLKFYQFTIHSQCLDAGINTCDACTNTFVHLHVNTQERRLLLNIKNENIKEIRLTNGGRVIVKKLSILELVDKRCLPHTTLSNHHYIKHNCLFQGSKSVT